VKDRTATLCVDAANFRLEDLVAAAEELGYAATVKSITSITPHNSDAVSSTEPPN